MMSSERSPGTCNPTAYAPAAQEVVPMDPREEVVAITQGMMSFPHDLLRRTDAIAVVSGLGDTCRIDYALNQWEDPETSARNLFVAGTNATEQTQPVYSLPMLTQEPFWLQRTDGVHVQGATSNTKTQGEWLAQKVKDEGITSVGLVVSAFHVVRAGLTVAAAFKRAGLAEVPVFPIAVPASPATIVPETSQTHRQMSPGDLERIDKYRPGGDVLSAKAAEEYVNWLWSHGNIVQPPRRSRPVTA